MSGKGIVFLCLLGLSFVARAGGDDRKISQYFCEYCGTERSSVSSLTAGMCGRHPSGSNQGRHKLYESESKERYTCKYCGTQRETISSLTAGKCSRHPNGTNKGHHAPALIVKVNEKGEIMGKNYWGFRVDKGRLTELSEELSAGRLRQGWGWDERQDLRKMTLNEGAFRNLRMLHQVKKGDVLLIPHLPTWGLITVAEATEDWLNGYYFEPLEKTKDHGHVFPVKIIQTFNRNNEHVSGNIRSTLRNPCRFWNINHHGEQVERILSAESDCGSHQVRSERLLSAIQTTVLDSKDKFVTEMNRQFNATEWEMVLVDIFNELYPAGNAERVGGPKEVEHGTDILITIPGVVPDTSYCIAVQVKDYERGVGESPVDQVLKADSYWGKDGLTLIEKVVVLIRASEKDNEALSKYASEKGVKIMFDRDVNDLMFQFACRRLGQESDKS